MPFVRIDTLAGQFDVHQRAIISDVLYSAVLGIGALKGDRFQIFAEHELEDFAFDPGYLGIRRTEGFIAIQITLVEGRTRAQKKDLFAVIADSLHERVGIRREDVFVNLVEVAKENWSFGGGVAQYADAHA
ncbi:tautomerase family protein [Bradyrhizobium sp.]|uniref:tautomerase family protein n=1 Tax=Bradyrhizobium sp. TaxID=376 RepID=UPI003C3BF129